MKQGGFTWLKKNSNYLVGVLHVFSLFIFSVFNQTFIFLFLTFLILFFIILRFGIKYNLLLKTISISSLSILVLLYDNIIIPDLATYVPIRFLILLIFIFFLFFRFYLIKSMIIFLLSNIFYLVIAFFIPNSVKQEKIEFTKSARASLVRYKINEWVQNEDDILVILVDGYPSERILKHKYRIDSEVKKLKLDLNYVENQSTYLSTPLSTTSQLFGVDFIDSTHNVDWGKENVSLLFKEAQDSSILNLTLKHYTKYYHTFLNDLEAIRGSQWRTAYRAIFVGISEVLIRRLNFQILNKNFDNYNKKTLTALENHKWDPVKKEFYFVHFLTFHNIYNVENELEYANGFLIKTFQKIPESTKVIIFSDHGMRSDSDLSDLEKRSGIFYYSQ
jgi:hypothetical protein